MTVAPNMPTRENGAFHAVKPWHKPSESLAGVRWRGDQPSEKADRDHGQHPSDDTLKSALAATVLQEQQSGRDTSGDERSHHQR